MTLYEYVSPDERARALASRIYHDGAIVIDPVTRRWHAQLTAKSGREYRIRPDGRTLILRKNGSQWASACFQVGGGHYYPVHDRMIAEYLYIKNDERRYLRIANTSPPRGAKNIGLCLIAGAAATAIVGGLLMLVDYLATH